MDKAWSGVTRALAIQPVATHQSEALIRAAVRSGAGQMMWAADTFAYAERYDAVTKRYLGLVAGEQGRQDPLQHGEDLLGAA